ncbi:DUF5789 family protein [Halorubrum tebenquichense]|uniref:DUF2795 domain-containing protein n=1 Tax=Halorubrum tebenquichense DSM 14210 TaxID=1227485 RepID=M0DS61_9EURY|nr:hypothetical protein [Halorubrum tebenquichense]ELZ37688.1 hypothetical protein C472_08149 [Halorubrum tebenquichense DSM 14210]
MANDNTELGSEGPTRAPNVSFGPLKRALREHRYPVTAAELIEQYGGAELETRTATERFARLLEDCEETQFREPSDVREAVLDALGYDDASPDIAPDDWTSLR